MNSSKIDTCLIQFSMSSILNDFWTKITFNQNSSNNNRSGYTLIVIKMVMLYIQGSSIESQRVTCGSVDYFSSGSHIGVYIAHYPADHFFIIHILSFLLSLIIINVVFSTFGFNFFPLEHFLKLYNSSFICFSSFFYIFCYQINHSVVSKHFHTCMLDHTFGGIHILNDSTLLTEPCRTPKLFIFTFDFTFFLLTVVCVRFVRYVLYHSSSSFFTPISLINSTILRFLRIVWKALP